MIYEVVMNIQSCSCQMRPDHSREERMTILSGGTGRRETSLNRENQLPRSWENISSFCTQTLTQLEQT